MTRFPAEVIRMLVFMAQAWAKVDGTCAGKGSPDEGNMLFTASRRFLPLRRRSVHEERLPISEK